VGPTHARVAVRAAGLRLALDAYGQALAAVGASTLALLDAFETLQRRIHPPRIASLREQLAPLRDHQTDALARFRESAVPDGLAPFHEQLASGAQAALDAAHGFTLAAPAAELAARVLASFSGHCRAQESLYPLRLALPPLGRFFAEPAWHARLAELDPEPAAGVTLGLHRGGPDDGVLPRGAFSLYVPERCDGKTPLPLVVALHGGFGHGHDFVWTWLREARCAPCLLLAPSSRGSTWSLDAPAGDVRMLHSLVESVCANWPVDRSRMLLTGLSDGATFTLLAGLAADSPFSHLAPVSGVLHPANFANGNLARARGRRVRLCHGALDWLFPVTLAQLARDELVRAGAEVEYREIPDLSHAYPREENRAILNWLGQPGAR
jgi:phospholipase/carboxylesterase